MSKSESECREQAAVSVFNSRLYIETITAELAELAAKHQAEPSNWGIVGSMGRIEEALSRLAGEIIEGSPPCDVF